MLIRNKIIQLTLFLLSSILIQTTEPFIDYYHPSTDAGYITPQSQLLIKVKPQYQNYLSTSKINFEVIGEKSGKHEGRIVVSGNTINFKPYQNFSIEENVNVSVTGNFSWWSEPLTYSFKTGRVAKFDQTVFSGRSVLPSNFKKKDESALIKTGSAPSMINGVAVPSDFPKFDPSINLEETANGKIFITHWGTNPYIIIFKDDGTPYYYKRIEGPSFDFKVQPTGKLTRWYSGGLNAFVGMNNDLAVIDTFKAVNGYVTDEHELHMTEEGNYFVIALGYRQVDAVDSETGEIGYLTLIENHIQEFDKNHNLVFEWLSNEHFDFRYDKDDNRNIYRTGLNTTSGSKVDYIHMNSIAIDYDGHILISSRHLNEVTKINRQTGEIIWRLGGEHNQFEFVNDYGFSWQHDIRPVPGKPGYYTLFDNGNERNEKFSRAVEYKIDTLNYTAAKVWEYRHTPDLYTSWMGNAQRLSNGNTLINFVEPNNPKAVEVTPSGEVVYQSNFSESTPVYRTFRFDWNGEMDRPQLIIEPFPERIFLLFNKFGDDQVDKYIIYRGKSKNEMVPVDTTKSTMFQYKNLDNNTTYYFKVGAVDNSGNISKFSNIEEVFVRYVPPGINLVENGDFSEGEDKWIFTSRDTTHALGGVNPDQEFVFSSYDSPGEINEVQLRQDNIPLVQGRQYRFEFKARAAKNLILDARVEKNKSPYDNYGKISPSFVTTQMKKFIYEFEMEHPNDYKARVVFSCRLEDNELHLDDISLKEINITGVEEDETYIDYELYQNYPNPFNPSTVISFQLAAGSHVSLVVYDMLGRKVQTLINKKIQPGSYEVEFEGTGLSSGIYFYRLTTGSFTQTKKMLLIR